MVNFDELTLNQIVALAKNNNRSAFAFITKKYEGIIRGIIKKNGYFLQGGDYDDLFQEGLIGLYKAIRDFQEENGEFDIFSKICIRRQLISAIKTSTRRKHSPLNDMISLDRTLPENDNLSMMDLFGARGDVQFSVDFTALSPEEQAILTETFQNQKRDLEKSLSHREKIIFDLYLEHKSYKEIMEDLNVDNPKMIDNAIQRVKRKIERIKQSEIANSKIKRQL